ncbi:unnamed protein product [Vicia faba]|uniref:Uncharacterized protein n=1 Tax=Vicia faba TaxID=3906 RepID=A0AAV0YYT2_VICFA|nr:unnamed protein product [Vicia faba]
MKRKQKNRRKQVLLGFFSMNKANKNTPKATNEEIPTLNVLGDSCAYRWCLFIGTKGCFHSVKEGVLGGKVGYTTDFRQQHLDRFGTAVAAAGFGSIRAMVWHRMSKVLVF